MGGYILQFILNSYRLKYLQRAVRAAGPTSLSVPDLIINMSFTDTPSAVTFLASLGCAFNINGEPVDDVDIVINALREGQSTMPTVEVDCSASSIEDFIEE